MAEPQGYDLRYWFIELCAYWEGRINVKQLADEFHLSRQQASKILSGYRQQYPEQLRYSPTNKAYLPTTSFLLHYLSGDSEEYLSWLQGNPRQHIPIQCLTAPARQIPVEILRPMVQALTTGMAVDTEYAAINGIREERLIAPQQLVYGAGRWHVRAWCFLRQQYRDFVLSRFLSAALDDSKTPPSEHPDTAWLTMITLIFAPDPRLDLSHQQVLQQEYGMQAGRLTVTIRAALANYLLHEMGISARIVAGDPEAQQLVLVNKRDIEQWLY